MYLLNLIYINWHFFIVPQTALESPEGHSIHQKVFLEINPGSEKLWSPKQLGQPKKTVPKQVSHLLSHLFVFLRVGVTCIVKKTLFRYRTEAIFDCASVEADVKRCKGTMFYKKTPKHIYHTKKERILVNKSMISFRFGIVIPKNKQNKQSTFYCHVTLATSSS